MTDCDGSRRWRLKEYQYWHEYNAEVDKLVPPVMGLYEETPAAEIKIREVDT